MDNAYERAQLRREELRKELEEIELFLKLHHKFSTGTGVQQVTQDEDGPVILPPISKTKRNLSKHKMARTVRSIMIDKMRPMTRTDIVEALELTGVPVAGVDKSKAVGTIMWRLRDRFVNIPGYGYWPNDLDCEAAGYTVGQKPAVNINLL